MMSCATGNWYDLCLIRGESFFRSVSLKTTSGTPLNLSAYYVTGLIIGSYNGPQFVAFSGSISEPTSSGVVTFGLTTSQTTGLPITQGLYYLDAINSGDNSQIELLKGYININPL